MFLYLKQTTETTPIRNHPQKKLNPVKKKTSAAAKSAEHKAAVISLKTNL
jgi:hypothetical protein